MVCDAGANPNLADQDGCLPLHYACMVAATGYPDLLEEILASGDNSPVAPACHTVRRWILSAVH